MVALRSEPKITLEDHHKALEIKFGGRDFCVFVRQLAALTQAGVPIPSTLDTLADQNSRTVLGPVLSTVSKDITSGMRLSTALSRYPGVFREVFTAMVKVGEESGKLVAVFNKLAEWEEDEFRLRRRVSATLTYPVFVAFVTGTLMLTVFYFVVPRFLVFLEGMEGSLPFPTRMIMFLSDLGSSPVFLLSATIMVVSFLALVQREMARPAGRIQCYRLLHSLPAVGPLVKLTAVTRFSNAMFHLLETGLPMKTTIGLAARSSANPLLISVVDEMIQGLLNGEPMARFASERPDVFPDTFSQYMSVGEETGQLGRLMKLANSFYEHELSFRIEVAVNLIEPFLMGTISVIVGFVIIAMAGSVVTLFQ